MFHPAPSYPSLPRLLYRVGDDVRRLRFDGRHRGFWLLAGLVEDESAGSVIVWLASVYAVALFVCTMQGNPVVPRFSHEHGGQSAWASRLPLLIRRGTAPSGLAPVARQGSGALQPRSGSEGT